MPDNFTTPVPDGTEFASKKIGDTHFPKNVLTDFAGEDVLGLVTDSPAANSLLGRLKAVADAVATMGGHVDGLEGLAATLNGLVDGLEALIGTSNASLVALAGYVDGLEALAAAAIPTGDNVIGRVGVDQTTDGTTNKVNIDASLRSGAAATTPAMTTASATVLASNAARKGGTIYNPNAAALRLNLAGGDAATTPHVRLAQYQSHEVGAGYTGAITGALESSSGAVNVVENV